MKHLQDAMNRYRRQEELRISEERRIKEERRKACLNMSRLHESSSSGNRQQSLDVRLKRKPDETLEMKENKRPRSNFPDDTPKNGVETMMLLRRDHQGMVQLRMEKFIKRETKQEVQEKLPEIITLDDSLEEEIKVIQVVTKVPLSIRRRRIKEEPEQNTNSVTLSSNPLEVKRQIAMEDDGMRNVLQHLQRQNMCISSTLNNPVAPPTAREVKPEIPFVLPPGISQYKNGVKIHDGTTSTQDLIELSDSDEEMYYPSQNKGDGIASYTGQIRLTDKKMDTIQSKVVQSQKKDDDDIIVLSSDDDEPPERVNKPNTASLAMLEAQPKPSESSPKTFAEKLPFGSLKIKSMKELTGTSPPKHNNGKTNIESQANKIYPEVLENTEKTSDPIQPSQQKTPLTLTSSKTWGLTDDKYKEIEKQIWESDDEEIIALEDSNQGISKSQKTNLLPHSSNLIDSSRSKSDKLDVQTSVESLSSQIDLAVRTMAESPEAESNASVDTDAETVIDENELSSVSQSITAEEVIPASHEKDSERSNTAEQELPTSHEEPSERNDRSSGSKSWQFNLQNLVGEARQYTKALITRQKLSNECIDITNRRSRTEKFDSKKEAMLSTDQLDDRGRPIAEPFDNYTTTQLFETTFNCTELIGIAELLDTIQALSSATCSKYFAR